MMLINEAGHSIIIIAVFSIIVINDNAVLRCAE